MEAENHDPPIATANKASATNTVGMVTHSVSRAASNDSSTIDVSDLEDGGTISFEINASASSETQVGEAIPADPFHVNLAEYLDDVTMLEGNVDRTGLEDVVNANSITSDHVKRRDRVEESFLSCLAAVGKFQWRFLLF